MKHSPLQSGPHSSGEQSATASIAELDFEAFRYVAGEMADADMAAFEERLATDQSAREAVARAVEIGQAVTVLGPQALPGGSVRRQLKEQPSHQTGEQRTRRRAAVVAVLATVVACLALVLALEPFGPGSPRVDDRQADRQADSDLQPGQRGHDRRANAARLVEFWSDAEDLVAADPAMLEALNSVWSDEAGPGGDNGNENDFAWMLAAVSAELPMPDDGSEPPSALPHPLSPSSREN